MDYTATINAVSPNYNNPDTFILVVNFSGPADESFTKEYIVPVSNSQADNEALIQVDIDRFTASSGAASQALSLFSKPTDSAISLSDDLSATLAAALAIDPIKPQ